MHPNHLNPNYILRLKSKSNFFGDFFSILNNQINFHSNHSVWKIVYLKSPFNHKNFNGQEILPFLALKSKFYSNLGLFEVREFGYFIWEFRYVYPKYGPTPTIYQIAFFFNKLVLFLYNNFFDKIEKLVFYSNNPDSSAL